MFILTGHCQISCSSYVWSKINEISRVEWKCMNFVWIWNFNRNSFIHRKFHHHPEMLTESRILKFKMLHLCVSKCMCVCDSWNSVTKTFVIRMTPVTWPICMCLRVVFVCACVCVRECLIRRISWCAWIHFAWKRTNEKYNHVESWQANNMKTSSVPSDLASLSALLPTPS